MLALLSLTSSHALAQVKVVVIPMSGDDSKPLKNIVSVAKANGDFSDPIAALASITDASLNNPYLIVIAPGEYTLAEKLIMKEWVSVSGSGEAATTLVSGFTGDSITSGYLVRLNDNSIVSHLTVKNVGGGFHSIGVSSIFNDSSARLENVSILASGGAVANRGFSSINSSPMIRDVSSTATGNVRNYAVANLSSSATYIDINAIAFGGSLTNRAVDNTGSSSPKMIEVDARGTGLDGWGMYNTLNVTPIVRRSTIAGQSGSIYTETGSTIKVSQSTVIGVPGGSGTQLCVASDDGNGNAKNSDCS